MAATLAVTACGGYFNGGVGTIIITLFSLLGYRDLRAMIGLKSLMSSVLTLSSVVTYSLAGLVYWHLAVFMMLGSVSGGYYGSLTVQRLPKSIIRSINGMLPAKPVPAADQRLRACPYRNGQCLMCGTEKDRDISAARNTARYLETKGGRAIRLCLWRLA